MVYKNQYMLGSSILRKKYIGEPEYREEKYTQSFISFPGGGPDFILRTRISYRL